MSAENIFETQNESVKIIGGAYKIGYINNIHRKKKKNFK